MASASDMPAGLRWAWTDDDRRRVLARFKHGLYGVLRAFESWQPSVAEDNRAVLKELADRIEAAGIDLDVCASNCHAIANTLRSTIAIDGVQPATVHSAIRLSRVLGAPVVLTRTTIEQLAGKTLKLEYIEGANAIVQVDGEYWGTPLDRVLVVADPANPQDEPADPPAPATAGQPSFSFRFRRGELSNAIQFLTMTGRAGILTVAASATDNDLRGHLVLHGGRVIHAEWGSHQDVEAVARMMRLESSWATFEDSASEPAPTMNLATDQLLIEAAVKADEISS